MKLIKKLLALFSPLEMIILMVAITVSTLLVVPTFSSKKPQKVPVLLFPTEKVYSVNGGYPVDVFDTSFFIVYEPVKEETQAEIKAILNEYLVGYHKLFDRHHDYYAEAPLDPVRPTAEEKATLPRIKNLKYINDHKGEEVEIEKALYDLLMAAKQYSINTPHNAFSMFIGALYDYWKPYTRLAADPTEDPIRDPEKQAEIARLTSYIPKTAADINATLELRSEANKYYVRFNEFNGSGEDLSISVGAVAKGMMTDILGEVLRSRGLTKGLVFGGQSSFLFLEDGFLDKAYNITMEPIGPGEQTFTMSRADQYQMSTSGIYSGFKFNHAGEEIIRSHIIDPVTGYPAHKAHHMVNITSDTLSGLELDYLTTSLIVLDVNDGLTFINDIYALDDVNVIYGGLKDGEWFISRTIGYPGGKNPMFVNDSEYSEINLELLQ
ncbi:MAG: Thiamine biosynthesis lipoprotein ApbE precursor [Tenericutes bacterium ADurb.Bin087]|nr:MAG: Thiamine biosynthesis lipoprotein ApbE precursor [Tenericutes bacterium ADurb.Bin087]